MTIHAGSRRSTTRGRRRWTLLSNLVLGMALILTGCAGAEETSLPDDGPPPPITRDAALRFVQKTLTAGQRAAASRTFAISLTDTEVTSFLNIRRELTRELEQVGLNQLDQIEGLESLGGEEIDIDLWRALLGQREGSGGLRSLRLRIGLKDTRVHFKGDGRLIARGEIALLRWGLPIRFVIAPHAAEGELTFDFIEGQVGSIGMPKMLFDLLGKGLAEVLVFVQAYAEITQIEVGAGTLAISGRYKGPD